MLLASAERIVLQRAIEEMITTLHPDGIEAQELLAAILAPVESRYDNKYMALEDVKYHGEKLMAAFQFIYEDPTDQDIKEAYEELKSEDRRQRELDPA